VKPDTILHNSLLRSGRRWRPSSQTVARLRKLAARLGLRQPDTYRRLYPGYHQRSAGAWVWIAETTDGRDGDGYATLLHELAHHAGVRRPGPAQIPGHGPNFYRLLARAAEEVLRHPLELPLGPASRSVNRLLAVAFTAEVAAGRLPDWPGGMPPPDPRPLARRDPAHVSIPPAILADVEDVLQRT